MNKRDELTSERRAGGLNWRQTPTRTDGRGRGRLPDAYMSAPGLPARRCLRAFSGEEKELLLGDLALHLCPCKIRSGGLYGDGKSSRR